MPLTLATGEAATRLKADCFQWLSLLTHATDSYRWLTPLTHATDSCQWLMPLTHANNSCHSFLPLTHATQADSCQWRMPLTHANDSCHWLMPRGRQCKASLLDKRKEGEKLMKSEIIKIDDTKIPLNAEAGRALRSTSTQSSEPCEVAQYLCSSL